MVQHPGQVNIVLGSHGRRHGADVGPLWEEIVVDDAVWEDVVHVKRLALR